MSAKSVTEKIRLGEQIFVTSLLVLCATISPLLLAYPAHAATFSNDYPDLDAVNCSKQFGSYSWCKEEDGEQGYVLDEAKSSRGFYYRNCTDGVAYWVKKYTSVTIPGSWSNATYWDTKATGYTVKDGNSNSIEPGDIAQSDTAAGGFGHVGLVTEVTKDSSGVVTSIKVAELNHSGDGEYNNVTTYSSKTDGYFKPYTNDRWDHFIDVNGEDKGLNDDDVSQPALGDGTTVKYDNKKYIVAGGAPIYINDWSAVGGEREARALTTAEWNSLRQYPKDGTFIKAKKSSGTGMNSFVMAGGAPIYVSDWGAVGGSPNTITWVDVWAIEHPNDSRAHLRGFPADGAFIKAKNASGTGYDSYVVVGGAPIYISDWEAINREAGSGTLVDRWSVYNPGDSRTHLLEHPRDGRFIRAKNADGTGTVAYVIAGGAPVYVSDWDAVGGQPSVVTMVDAWSINHPDDSRSHLRQFPKDGTFIKANNSDNTGTNSFIMAGGAPIYISDWAAVGGQPSSVTHVDAWSTTHTSDARTHLRAAPLDGTALRDLATGQLYTVTTGTPYPVSAVLGAATNVDQYSINFVTTNGYWPRVN